MELFCSDGATLATSTDVMAAPRRVWRHWSQRWWAFPWGRRRGALALTCARAVIGRSDGPVRLGVGAVG